MEAERTFANIALLGFMAAGKSSVGACLAKRLQWALVDLDQVLVQREGRTIPQIFAEEGEEGFRRRESELLREVVVGERQVIACGGGVVLRRENRQRLRERCWVVLLWAQPETLLQRLLQDPTPRPVLGIGAGEQEPETLRRRLEEVLQQREPLYRAAADEVLFTDDREPEELAEELHRRWRSIGQD